MARIGLLGGSFDPIHVGHLIMAETAREACGLDQIHFVVAGQPPHKARLLTPGARRLEMVQIAIAGNPAFVASEWDLRRPGPHYTVDLLTLAQAERPGDELFFLIGADSLVDLPQWRRPDRIAELCRLVVMNRPGVSSPARTLLETADGPKELPLIEVTIPQIGIASRELRRRVAAGQSIRYQVPAGVFAYIRENQLYRTTSESV